MLFLNDEKRHFLCSDDDENWHGPRDSQGQFINDIKLSVRRSVRPSNERKWTKSADEVVASYVPPRYLFFSVSGLVWPFGLVICWAFRRPNRLCFLWDEMQFITAFLHLLRFYLPHWGVSPYYRVFTRHLYNWNTSLPHVRRRNIKEQEKMIRKIFENLIGLDHPNIVKFHKYWTEMAEASMEKPRVVSKRTCG